MVLARELRSARPARAKPSALLFAIAIYGGLCCRFLPLRSLGLGSSPRKYPRNSSTSMPCAGDPRGEWKAGTDGFHSLREPSPLATLGARILLPFPCQPRRLPVRVG